jgi:hypothetical protein
MDSILALFTQPLIVALIGIVVFTGRVILVARRLRSASRSPSLADLRALDEAKMALDTHRKSLDGARETLERNIGGARDTLRHYKGPLNTSVEGRRRGIEDAMKNLEDFKDPLDRARAGRDTAYKQGLKDAKKIVQDAMPRKIHRARKDI